MCWLEGWIQGKKVATNQLTNWDKELQRWTTMLPPMRSARQDCTVVTHKQWLLVAGGVNYKKPIYNVELLDLNTVQWLMTHPLPKPSVGMTSCVVKNTWYLLGGMNFTEPVKGETGPKEYVFSLTLDENIATNKWVQVPDTPLYCCTAVPFGDHLMAVGGTDSLTSRTYSASMFLYILPLLGEVGVRGEHALSTQPVHVRGPLQRSPGRHRGAGAGVKVRQTGGGPALLKKMTPK